jgi:tetratricopeptide (TPR) repeat protein
MKYLLGFITVFLLCTSCSKIIPGFVPAKKGKISKSEIVMEADKYFWDNFHSGNFDSIPRILEKLQAAYYKYPNDYKIAAHLGFTHAWALAESNRLENQTARVTDHSTLAVKYFQEAFDMHPEKEWRYYGFLTSMMMAEGSIHNDDKQIVEGYFKLKKSARKYPEFNLFTAAYTLASSPRKKDRDTALEMLWKNLDKCIDGKVDRENLDYTKYMHLKDTESRKSTCWNTWIAPHNMEGFLLVLGDELLKRGDFETAIKVYKNAMLFEGYEQWGYKTHLENRIEEAELAIGTRKIYKEMKLLKYDRCMVCHQGKEMQSSPENVHLQRPIMEVTAHLKK